MKESLVSLLLEEYKQLCLFNDLEKKGIDLNNITVNNSDIVYDLIGFPKDNMSEYDVNALNDMPHNSTNGKAPDSNMFCRDWLYDAYYDVVVSIDKKQKIEVTDKGLKMVEYDDELEIRNKLSDFVDWLYVEYTNIN
jgi:hypothetical protein